MNSGTSHMQFTDTFFDTVAASNKKNGLSLDKRSPTEHFQTAKLNGLNAQEYKNSFFSFNKTDGQAKALYNNLHLPIGKDNSQLISRSFEKSRNNSDNIYDLGVTQETNDGTDSGVEVIRALSSNGSNSDRFTPIQSCGSSLVSYSSEPEVERGSECESESSGKSRVRKGSSCSSQSSSCWKSKKAYERSRVSRKINGYDGTSESCSETSSTHDAVTPDQLSRPKDFKRFTSNRFHESKKTEKIKSSTLRRSESSTRNSSHDKTSINSYNNVRSSSTSSRVSSGSKSHSATRIGKSTSSGKCEIKGSKKTEDGRWSSQKNQINGARIRVSSSVDQSQKISLNSVSCSMTSSFSGGNVKTSEGKSNALDKYGTLPRRPKRKSGDAANLSITQTLSRSHSVTREPSLNRAATLRRQQSREKENSSNCKSLPPYPRARRGTGRILIYHEIGVQTVITGEDISNASCSFSIKDKHAGLALQKENKEIQTEGKERLKIIEDDYAKKCEETEKARKENKELKLERQRMISRISKLLGYPESKHEELIENGLDELEKHFQAVGLTVIRQQEELSELRNYKLVAHRDLEKSLAAQKNLLQQQQEIEEEYSELQEFLQAEKTALSESLHDTEEELNSLRREVTKKQSLLERQQEECKHLVRICEQRRQENLSLEAKLAGLDQRSRDVLVQQGAAVSAAAVALSGLGARLDTLVDQLSISCNIREKDLEDVIYHNEAFSKSENSSPEEPLMNDESQMMNEPKQRESFIQIVLSAIKNAAHSSFSSKKGKDGKLSDQADTFFDTETEPSLNFENDLEETPSLSDAENQAGVKKDEKDVEINSELKYEVELSRSNSLQKLSDAILNRQMVEKNERFVALDEIIPIEVNSLVDQIVEVDNLVTKLLKVIRIIQRNTEQYVEKLREERENLTDQLQQEKTNRCKIESSLYKLQKELTEARCQLNTRITQLEEVKALSEENQQTAFYEMEKRFAIVDNALGALSSVQDMINQCPQLAKLQHELKDCSFQRIPVTDVNANSPTNDNGLVEETKHRGAVLTTAI